MQRSATTSGSTSQNAGIVFLTNIWGSTGSSSNSHSNTHSNAHSNSHSSSNPNGTRSRPGTSSGDREQPSTSIFSSSKDKDHHSRRPSFGRKASFSSPSKGKRRQSSSASNGNSAQGVVTDASTPPALPDLAKYLSRENHHSHHHHPHHHNHQTHHPHHNHLKDVEATPSPVSGDSFSKMIGRSAPTPTNGFYTSSAVSPPIVTSGLQALQPEAPSLHQHIQDIANKRISTLDYLRKAHEGRVYWFNTLLFDKPDLQRMPYFDGRKIARRATNYLLLGLSLPAVIDLNSSTPLEFLRSLNTLLAEFESYQQIHTETGVSTSSLSRARFPQMFRRGPGGKGRRQSGAAGAGMDYFDGGNSGSGAGGANGGGGSSGGAGLAADGSAVNSAPAGVISFGLGGEGNDLLPGEEYTHLLTPNLPFDPDFFETFATLCDVLIDCYARLMSLLPSPRDCSPVVAELFHKADARVRKIIIQGVVKEFEDSSRAGLKQEVASVGKVVLGGLI
ncbi:hypothetical protein F4775DRAFT_315947 [Biscogniauxia sp. FL1348]|nr:hypothetical protein F4775DRAFT_315947 [Biscogniauxia sp. FL1348]